MVGPLDESLHPVPNDLYATLSIHVYSLYTPQLSVGWIVIPLSGLTMPYICACPYVMGQ